MYRKKFKIGTVNYLKTFGKINVTYVTGPLLQKYLNI